MSNKVIVKGVRFTQSQIMLLLSIPPYKDRAAIYSNKLRVIPTLIERGYLAEYKYGDSSLYYKLTPKGEELIRE